MPHIFVGLAWCVVRRIGGLENVKLLLFIICTVVRRIGGLEIYFEVFII